MRISKKEEMKKGVLGKKDCVFECDPRFSYRRANIHQRQVGFKFDNFKKIDLFYKIYNFLGKTLKEKETLFIGSSWGWVEIFEG